MLTLEPRAVRPAPAGDAGAALALSIVIADDHPLYRAGIVRTLEASGTFAAIHEASDGATALALIRTRDPDAAVLDVRMAGMDGIDVVAALARHGPAVPVVLLSAFDDEHLVTAGLEAGAAAYVSKAAEREAICAEIAAAALAHEARSPRALHGPPDFAPARMSHWTPRLTSQEHALLLLAQGGWHKPELAFLTGVEEPALRRRLDSIFAKLGADDLGQALAVAAARGIIGPEELILGTHRGPDRRAPP